MAHAAVPLGMIDPQEFDRPELGKQLPELGLLHIRLIAARMIALIVGKLAFGETQREFDPVLVARLVQLGEHIASQRRLGHLAHGGSGVPHAEAVVMFGEEDDISHLRLLG